MLPVLALCTIELGIVFGMAHHIVELRMIIVHLLNGRSSEFTAGLNDKPSIS